MAESGVTMVVLVGIVFFAVMIRASSKDAAKNREQREHLKYVRYGSNHEPNWVKQVDKGRSFYKTAVRRLANGDAKEAQEAFRESVASGYLPALTAQGILALRRGDLVEARREWERAASRGEVAAKILLILDDGGAVDFGPSRFASDLFRADDTYLHDEDARDFVIGVADQFGFEDWARARAIEEKFGLQ